MQLVAVLVVVHEAIVLLVDEAERDRLGELDHVAIGVERRAQDVQHHRTEGVVDLILDEVRERDLLHPVIELCVRGDQIGDLIDLDLGAGTLDAIPVEVVNESEQLGEVHGSAMLTSPGACTS